MRAIYLAMLMAMTALASVPAQAESDLAGKPLDLCGYTMAFHDEFDDLSVSARILGGKRWIAHTPWGGDFGDATFMDPGAAGPFRVRGGHLEITARRDRQGEWMSGLIAASDASGNGAGLRYGYFEARMRMPPGPGTWPAFWLMSRKRDTDRSPSVEIDVVEYYGHDPSSYSATWHTYYRSSEAKRNAGETVRIAVPAGSLVRDFHTYGVLIQPGTVTYYLDRKPVWRQPTPKELTGPLFPLVNLALGSGYPIHETPDPSVLTVDYVRIYEPPGDKAAAACRKPAH